MDLGIMEPSLELWLLCKGAQAAEGGYKRNSWNYIFPVRKSMENEHFHVPPSADSTRESGDGIQEGI